MRSSPVSRPKRTRDSTGTSPNSSSSAAIQHSARPASRTISMSGSATSRSWWSMRGGGMGRTKTMRIWPPLSRATTAALRAALRRSPVVWGVSTIRMRFAIEILLLARAPRSAAVDDELVVVRKPIDDRARDARDQEFVAAGGREMHAAGTPRDRRLHADRQHGLAAEHSVRRRADLRAHAVGPTAEPVAQVAPQERGHDRAESDHHTQHIVDHIAHAVPPREKRNAAAHSLKRRRSVGSPPCASDPQNCSDRARNPARGPERSAGGYIPAERLIFSHWPRLPESASIPLP